jgi:serine/threonine protein kinase
MLHTHSSTFNDWKQPNILLSFGGVVKICDFGQSRFNNDQRGLASEASFTFQATYRYMSPELFDKQGKVKPTALSDIWAYGCVALQVNASCFAVHQSDVRMYTALKSTQTLPYHQRRFHSLEVNNRGSLAQPEAGEAVRSTLLERASLERRSVVLEPVGFQTHGHSLA